MLRLQVLLWVFYTSLHTYSFQDSIKAEATRARTVHSRDSQPCPFQQLTPLSLRSLHSPKSHHAQVHQSRKIGCAYVGEYLVNDYDTGVMRFECSDGVRKDSATGLVRPIVEYVAEEVD